MKSDVQYMIISSLGPTYTIFTVSCFIPIIILPLNFATAPPCMQHSQFNMPFKLT